MAKKLKNIFIVFQVIFGLLAIITLPGFFNYFYRLGAGHAFIEMMDKNKLDWNSLMQEERKPYQDYSDNQGFKCAVFMTIGQHVPMYLFIIITIGLLNRSITNRLRVFLRFAFWGVWLVGATFLAIGSGYWGQAIQFPKSVLPAVLIYLIVAIFCGIILGISKLIQKSKGAKSYSRHIP